jgi:NAD(P)-dependent dehydrogenase (short-subunit alcohol dehydrogenase family)
MIKKNVDQKVIIVTGGGRGLGREFALSLASHGAKVVVNDLGGDVIGVGKNASAADKVVREIQSLGGDAVADYSSVTTKEGGQSICSKALEHYGQINGVIHNAGILRDKSFTKMSSEDLDAVLDVHLKGAFNVLQPAYKSMKENNWGRIVLISSASGIFGNFGQSNYGAAKMGLLGLMRVLNAEGNTNGILVNAIAPNAKTRMTENILGKLEDKLDPSHIAPLGTYLCSDECNFANHIYSAGGGRIARIFIGLSSGVFFKNHTTTVDKIRNHIAEINSIDSFVVPDYATDELKILQETLLEEG